MIYACIAVLNRQKTFLFGNAFNQLSLFRHFLFRKAKAVSSIGLGSIQCLIC
ncbi:hypothetical protein [Bacillus sp. OV322]|uniref:hypothetical protein n=1 Tax=Bacillus sp. OV322 TaxID=1882764 RepID=UPI002108CD7B|nr:hypothetical protein [Bacillus sp. OV322]